MSCLFFVFDPQFNPICTQDILSKTSDYPEQLANTIAAIRATLPTDWTIPHLDEIFSAKENALEDMAKHLGSLAEHYEQMAEALQDSDAGEVLGEEEIQGLYLGVLTDSLVFTCFFSYES